MSAYQNSYILRIWNGTRMEFDVIVDGKVVETFTDCGDAKQYCIDNKLSRRISNYRLEYGELR